MSKELKRAREFWLPLITTDGKMDEKKVMNELCDYLYVMEEAREVYCHVTGGVISKLMTPANRVIAFADDLMTEIVEQEIAEHEHQKELDNIDFKKQIDKVKSAKK